MCQRVRGHEKGDCTRARRAGGGRRGWWPSVGAQARQRMSEWRRSAGRGMRGISRLIHGRVRAGRRLEAALWRPLPLAPIGPRPDVPATARCRNVEMPDLARPPGACRKSGAAHFRRRPSARRRLRPVAACHRWGLAVLVHWLPLARVATPATGTGTALARGGTDGSTLRARDGDGGEWARGRQAADSQVAGRRRPQAAAHAGSASACVCTGMDVMVENWRNEGIGRPRVQTDWSTALLVRQKTGNRIGVLCGQ